MHQQKSTKQAEASEPSWKFSQEDNTGANTELMEDSGGGPSVSWTASEYIAHQKSAGWFVGLGLVLAVISLATYFVTKDFFSAGLVTVMVIAFGIFAVRPPRELEYTVDNRGIYIGERAYPYAAFKSFTIIYEGPIRSVTFNPLQRFMLPVSIYYAPEDEDKIIEAISVHLPFEEQSNDIVDRLMRRIRF